MPANAIRVALIALLPLLNACTAGSPSPPCFLNVSLYDARGNPLQFKITKVSLVERNPGTNLLTMKESQLRLAAGSQRLLFPEQALGADLEVTLSFGDRDGIKARVTLAECEQRWSVQGGWLSSEFDTSGATVTGRLAGCVLSGDWWIRAMPMYGGQGIISDGYINPVDGSFRVPVATTGGRHILIFGKEKTPLKSLGIDVTAGEKNNMGLVDLSGSCPK